MRQHHEQELRSKCCIAKMLQALEAVTKSTDTRPPLAAAAAAAIGCQAVISERESNALASAHGVNHLGACGAANTGE